MDSVDLAKQIVKGERADQYGRAENSFEYIAQVWTGLLGPKLSVPVSGQDVALMMVGLKLVRQAHQHKPDNFVDGHGYLILAERIVGDPRPAGASGTPESQTSDPSA